MISAEAALDLIKSTIQPLGKETIRLENGQGYILANDILSPIDMPSFNQSAMDGYALNFIEGQKEYEVVGEVAAGSSDNPELKKGEGVRIFTGAMVPSSANIVVQQEWIERTGSRAKITRDVQVGKNIRPKGEQIKEGSLALPEGFELNPAGIGFLAGLGIAYVEVYRKPKISLITTGNELVKPGEELLPGQIYESNSEMLRAALSKYGYSCEVETVSDHYDETLNRIEKAISVSDVLLLTGGISVGDYDFVGKALQELNAKQLFYKVKQKPGKPLYFGKVKNTQVAALPGNPAAAMTSFYIYVLPMLNRLSGKKFQGLNTFELPLSQTYTKKGDRAEFLKAEIINSEVYVLEGQSSAMLYSFARANALIYIPEECSAIQQGEKVLVYQI